MKNYIVPAVIVAVGVITFSKVFYTSETHQSEKKKIRAEEEQRKTKEYLEESARAEIDFLSKKYNIDILQDQLSKNKEEKEQTP